MPTTTIDTDVIAASVAAYTPHAAEYDTWSAGIPMTAPMAIFTASLAPGARILDAGCGTGRDLDAFAAAGYTPVGADLSEAFCDIARAKGHQVELTDLRDLPFPNESFNGIWSCASLVHMPFDAADKALGEFARLLPAGAPLFVTVKVGHDTGSWQDTPHGTRWFNYWQPGTFARAVAEAGFTVGVANASETWVEIHALRS